MLTGIQNVLRPTFSHFQENALITLKNVDKRIAAAAVVTFALIALSLGMILLQYRKRKIDVQDKMADRYVGSNPTEEAAGKKPTIVKKVEEPAVKGEPSKMPYISGRNLMWYDLHVCKNLFEILYAKEFFDSEDSKTIKVIDAFAKHIQDGEYGKDITVNIYMNEAAPESCRDELMHEGCIFHIYTVHNSFGSSTYREIAISSVFFDSLKKLPQMPCYKGDFSDEHKKLLKKVVDVLDFALFKVNK